MTNCRFAAITAARSLFSSAFHSRAIATLALRLGLSLLSSFYGDRTHVQAIETQENPSSTQNLSWRSMRSHYLPHPQPSYCERHSNFPGYMRVGGRKVVSAQMQARRLMNSRLPS